MRLEPPSLSDLAIIGSSRKRNVDVTNSLLVSQIFFTNSGVQRMATSKQYPLLNRLTNISSVPSASSAVTFSYAYNSANQRTGFTNADNSYWAFGYDGLGQVTSGIKHWFDASCVPGEQFTYTFDDIGNRTGTSFGGDQFGGNLRSASYYANSLNQLTNRTVPGYANILGAAYSGASVTVLGPNGLVASTYRRGDFFRAEPVVDNSSTALWLTLTNFGVLTEGTNADIVTNITGSVLIPKTPESFYYDPDGNLTNDGRWKYTWDAENRLIAMTASSGVGPSVSLKFEYDWQGRRIHKQVWGNTGWSGGPTNDLKFIYDGWNLVGQFSSSNTVVQTFLWGTDLSATMQGAGGVGGLLAVKDAVQGAHFAAFDGNGNVSALVKASDGTVSAQYEYGPFGELLRTTGSMAKVSPLRFSSKYQEAESDLVYYPPGRYYIPSRGGWASRDPIGENGGLNMYAFVRNDPQRFVDSDGLQVFLSSPLETITEFGTELGGGDTIIRVGQGATMTGNSMGPGSIVSFGFRGPGLQPPVPIMPNPQIGDQPETQPQQGDDPTERARRTAQAEPNQSTLYRAMKADPSGGGPMTGESARTLGVRPNFVGESVMNYDVLVVGGMVSAFDKIKNKYQGMSVVPYRPNNLVTHRRPKSLLGHADSGPLVPGTGPDPVWEISKANLGPLLSYLEESPMFVHGVVAPNGCMRYEKYKQALERTKPFWRLTDLTPFIQTPFINP